MNAFDILRKLERELRLKLQRTKRNFVHYDGTLKFMIIVNYFVNVPANMTKCRFQLYRIDKRLFFFFETISLGKETQYSCNKYVVRLN